MSVRHGCDQTLAAFAAAVAARHVRLGPSLVDEDQALDVQAALGSAPFLARSGDVGSTLLGSMACLFLNDRSRASSVPDMVAMLTFTPSSRCDQSTSSASVASGCSVTYAASPSRWPSSLRPGRPDRGSAVAIPSRCLRARAL